MLAGQHQDLNSVLLNTGGKAGHGATVVNLALGRQRQVGPAVLQVAYYHSYLVFRSSALKELSWSRQ